MAASLSGQSKSRVLIIDDEQNVLLGLRRQLHRRFDIILAVGADEGMAKLHEQGPFAVVVCDMNMPGRTGIEVLADIGQQAPDTIQIMLTGQADLTTAMNAVNHGRIFRFFTKPCAAETLVAGLEAAIEHHRLVTAERDLLGKTLAGSIKVLTDVLALIDPESFGRTERARRWAGDVAGALGLERHRWKLEMATMLAPIGLAALPQEVARKARLGQGLTPIERDMVDASAETAHKLICNIPRLQEVADYVLYQGKNADGSGFPVDGKAGCDIPIGARIIRILNDLAQYLDQGMDPQDALALMGKQEALYDLKLLQHVSPLVAGDQSPAHESGATVIDIRLCSLQAGDVLQTPIVDADSGDLILAEGTTITELYVKRLANLCRVRNLTPGVTVRRTETELHAATA